MSTSKETASPTQPADSEPKIKKEKEPEKEVLPVCTWLAPVNTQHELGHMPAFAWVKEISIKKEKEAEKTVGEVHPPAAAAAVVEAASSSSAPSAPQAAITGDGGDLQPTSNADHGDGEDIAQSFVPIADFEKKSEPTQQERFMDADLICPGICLKKAKMAFEGTVVAPLNALGIVGRGTIKMYKIEKPCLESMVLGNAVDYQEQFWQEVSMQIGSRKVGAIICPDGSPFDVNYVFCLHVEL